MILLYLDPGSGSFIFQMLLASAAGIYAYLSTHYKQRLNYVVLVGAVIVIVCAFLPVTYCWDNTSQIIVCLNGKGAHVLPLVGTNLGFSMAILTLMFLKWKWRAIPWLVLGTAGVVIGILYALTLLQVFHGPGAIIPVAETHIQSSEIEQLVVIIGYIVILIGSIQEIIRRRRHYPFVDSPTIGSSTDVEDDDE